MALWLHRRPYGRRLLLASLVPTGLLGWLLGLKRPAGALLCSLPATCANSSHVQAVSTVVGTEVIPAAANAALL